MRGHDSVIEKRYYLIFRWPTVETMVATFLCLIRRLTPFGAAVFLGMACTMSDRDSTPERDPAPRLRIASFNVSMEAQNYTDSERSLSPDILKRHLASGDHPQIRNIAEIIQRVRPDILLLNEFDYIQPQRHGIDQFQQQYLGRSQSGQKTIHYPHVYLKPVNTGELMPVDVDGDGTISRPGDTYGYGHYPGQYAMVVLSRYPIDISRARTFQMFRWRDMPGALIPAEPDGTPYYASEAWSLFRLSSKSHWDLPIQIGERTLHLLASHPTPPVFDGPEDRNGRRNHDEIRLWVDYIAGEADYLYDDRGIRGGLDSSARFVVVGDLNASPVEGDGRPEAINALLQHPRITPVEPKSLGGAKRRPDNRQAPSHTASWGQRADYVLPSSNLTVLDSGIFWPPKDHPLAYLVEDRQSSSDHRLVWVDVAL